MVENGTKHYTFFVTFLDDPRRKLLHEPGSQHATHNTWLTCHRARSIATNRDGPALAMTSKPTNA